MYIKRKNIILKDDIYLLLLTSLFLIHLTIFFNILIWGWI